MITLEMSSILSFQRILFIYFYFFFISFFFDDVVFKSLNDEDKIQYLLTLENETTSKNSR